MATKKEKTKEQRIKTEKTRLKGIFKDLDENKRKLVTPLIEKAAFMSVELDDLQAKLEKDGWTSEYQNGQSQWGTKKSPEAETYIALDTVGVAEFFALLYIAYEVVSIFKNMALCGLPVKKVWEKVREFLAKYTDELPDTDELDGDSTTGSVEEHRTQER